MAIKDFNGAEDQEDGNKTSRRDENKEASVKKGNTNERTEIKNAHATGDGSFGRNDESLPEETSNDQKEDNNY